MPRNVEAFVARLVSGSPAPVWPEGRGGDGGARIGSTLVR